MRYLTPLPVYNDTNCTPRRIHGHCKLALWHAVQALAYHYKMPAAWGRVFLPLCPAHHPARLIPFALAALRARKPLPLSQGEQLRDFVYAPDAAKLLVGLFGAPETCAFNIGSGEAAIRHRGHCGPIWSARLSSFWRAGPRRHGSHPSVANMQKLRDRLGLEALTPMSKSLDELIAS